MALPIRHAPVLEGAAARRFERMARQAEKERGTIKFTDEKKASFKKMVKWHIYWRSSPVRDEILVEKPSRIYHQGQHCVPDGTLGFVCASVFYQHHIPNGMTNPVFNRKTGKRTIGLPVAGELQTRIIFFDLIRLYDR